MTLEGRIIALIIIIRTIKGRTRPCTILTAKPNLLVVDVHDRMPVILRPEDYDLWLDPGITDAQRVVEFLQPFDSTLMKKYPISTRVNRPENDDQECAREVAMASPALRLF